MQSSTCHPPPADQASAWGIASAHPLSGQILQPLSCRAAQVPGENKDINVKRLNKRPMPPRFGRKLSPKQAELATHICLDCGACLLSSQRRPEPGRPADPRCAVCPAGYIYSKP